MTVLSDVDTVGRVEVKKKKTDAGLSQYLSYFTENGLSLHQSSPALFLYVSRLYKTPPTRIDFTVNFEPVKKKIWWSCKSQSRQQTIPNNNEVYVMQTKVAQH